MKMTLEEYILNPMGKKSAVLNAATREAIATDYAKRYARIMMREHSKMKYDLYREGTHNHYIAHFKIPSEVVPKFYYDVVFEFRADDQVNTTKNDLFKYECKFFSNDPAFVYTYAHVFNNEDLLIPQFKSKMSKKAIKKDAVDKNPSHVIGYVKTRDLAYLYMKSRGLNKVEVFNAQTKRLVYQTIRNNIEDADTKIKKRQDAGAKLEKEKRKEKAKVKAEKQQRNEEIKTINTKMNNVNTIKPKTKISARKSSRK